MNLKYCRETNCSCKCDFPLSGYTCIGNLTELPSPVRVLLLKNDFGDNQFEKKPALTKNVATIFNYEMSSRTSTN